MLHGDKLYSLQKIMTTSNIITTDLIHDLDVGWNQTHSIEKKN